MWLKFAIVAGVLALGCDAQLSAMFGNAIQADNCGQWSAWGPCIWIRGNNPRWHRDYFNQLLPGRKGCRQHVFFKLIKERWGKAFNNVFAYLRNVTTDEKPCGKCSYQQSCGRSCHRRLGSAPAVKLNPFFVAEKICSPSAIDGNDQSDACHARLVDGGCKLWPNDRIALPNVTRTMREVVTELGFLSCVRQETRDESVCRCCCHPYEPHPRTFKCQLKSGANPLRYPDDDTLPDLAKFIENK